MRVKFTAADATSLSKTEVQEIASMYILDDCNLIYLQAMDGETYSLQSTKPLNYFDVDSFEKWLEHLLINGYVDLTNTGYEFEIDDSDDDSEDEDED